MTTTNDKPYNGKLDVIGMGVSIACAIHCVLLPVFFSSLPLLGMEVLKNIFLETVTIVLSAAVGSWALLKGYRKYHHQLKPVLLFICAMGFLVTANFCNGATEIVLKIMAITGIITAHVLNLRYSHYCNIAGHSHHRQAKH